MYGMAAASAVMEPQGKRKHPVADSPPLSHQTHRLTMLNRQEHTIEVHTDEEAMRRFAQHLGIEYPLNAASFAGARARKIERIKDGMQIYPPVQH